MYIVVFNVGSADCELLEDGHGKAEQFETFEDANNEAEDWVDDQDYRSFSVFIECDHERNHLI